MTTTTESVAALQNESKGFHNYVEKDWLLKVQDKKLSDLYGEIQSIISEYGSILSKKDELIENLMSRQMNDNDYDYVYGYEYTTNLEETPQKDTNPKKMDDLIDDHIKELKICINEKLQEQNSKVLNENRTKFKNQITEFETLEINFINDRKAQVLAKLNSIINNDSPNANNERHDANETKNNILVDFQVLDQELEQKKSKSHSNSNSKRDRDHCFQVLYNRVLDNTEKNKRMKDLLLSLQDRFKAKEMKTILKSAGYNYETSFVHQFSKNIGLDATTKVLTQYEASLKETVQLIDDIFQIYQENYGITLPSWTNQEIVEIPSTGLYRQLVGCFPFNCKNRKNKIHPENSKTGRCAAQRNNAGAGDMMDQNDSNDDDMDQGEGKEKTRKYPPHDTLVWVLTLIRESLAEQLVSETKKAFNDHIIGCWTNPLDELFTANPLIQGPIDTQQEE